MKFTDGLNAYAVFMYTKDNSGMATSHVVHLYQPSGGQALDQTNFSRRGFYCLNIIELKGPSGHACDT